MSRTRECDGEFEERKRLRHIGAWVGERLRQGEAREEGGNSMAEGLVTALSTSAHINFHSDLWTFFSPKGVLSQFLKAYQNLP